MTNALLEKETCSIPFRTVIQRYVKYTALEDLVINNTFPVIVFICLHQE